MSTKPRMSMKSRWMIALAVVCAIVTVTITRATPIVGLNFANILAFGTVNTETLDRARVILPPSQDRRAR